MTQLPKNLNSHDQYGEKDPLHVRVGEDLYLTVADVDGRAPNDAHETFEDRAFAVMLWDSDWNFLGTLARSPERGVLLMNVSPFIDLARALFPTHAKPVFE